jgi:hypothetical protein
MKQDTRLPHSKLWYNGRDVLRSVSYALEDFVRAVPSKLSEELSETKMHWRILLDILTGQVPNERLKTGLNGVLVYDAIYSANRWGLDIGYRHTLKQETA